MGSRRACWFGRTGSSERGRAVFSEAFRLFLQNQRACEFEFVIPKRCFFWLHG